MRRFFEKVDEALKDAYGEAEHFPKTDAPLAVLVESTRDYALFRLILHEDDALIVHYPGRLPWIYAEIVKGYFADDGRLDALPKSAPIWEKD